MIRKPIIAVVGVFVMLAATGCHGNAGKSQLLIRQSEIGQVATYAHEKKPTSKIVFSSNSTAELRETEVAEHVIDSPLQAKTLVQFPQDTRVIALTMAPNDGVVVATETDSGKITFSQVTSEAQRTFYTMTKEGATKEAQITSVVSSPQGRVYVALSDKSRSRLFSLDPTRDTQQLPIDLGSQWHRIDGMAFMNNDRLWLADNDSVMSKASIERFVNATTRDPNATSFKGKARLGGLTAYGSQELVACDATSGKLQRYYVSDGINVIEGRQLASFCTGSAAIIADGRLAFTTSTGIDIAG